MDYTYEYSYNISSEPTDAVVMGILSIYLIILLVCLVFYLVSYILKAVGVYTMAKRQGMDYPWLAFVPFARTYLQGELAGSITLKKKTVKNPGIWYLALPFIFSAVITVFYIIFIGVVGVSTFMAVANVSSENGTSAASIGVGSIIGLIVCLLLFVIVTVIYEAIYKVLATLINYQILKRFTTRNMSIAHSVLCATVPMYEPICLFIMRNKDYNPGMEPKQGPPPITPVPLVPPVPPTSQVPPVPPVPPVTPTPPASTVPPEAPESAAEPKPPIAPEMPENTAEPKPPVPPEPPEAPENKEE